MSEHDIGIDVGLPVGQRVVAPLAGGPSFASLHRFRKHVGGMGGVVVIAMLIAMAILSPTIAPYDPIAAVPAARTQPPSTVHLFGTDNLGRDVLSRVMYGARSSLWVGIIAVIIGLLPGLSLGLIAGFYGRWADMVIMRFIDIMLAFPRILLALTIVFVLGPSLLNVVIAVGIASIPAYTRLVRGSVLGMNEYPYIEAARVAGCPNWKIMLRHILPNIVAPVIVLATLEVGVAIISVAGLSFLGMGVQPPTPEWGAILSQGRSYLRQAWWISTFPGAFIMLTVLAINLFGDGLRNALDVRLKGS